MFITFNTQWFVNATNVDVNWLLADLSHEALQYQPPNQDTPAYYSRRIVNITQQKHHSSILWTKKSLLNIMNAINKGQSTLLDLSFKCLRGDFCHFWHFNRYWYIYLPQLTRCKTLRCQLSLRTVLVQLEWHRLVFVLLSITQKIRKASLRLNDVNVVGSVVPSPDIVMTLRVILFSHMVTFQR